MKHKKLSDIQADVRTDYSKRVIFNVDELPVGGHIVQEVTIPPNTKQREHYHEQQTEIFFVLEGECYVFIDGEEFIAGEGDTFVCEVGDKHYFWNKSDSNFSLLVFKINRPTDSEDTIWL